MAAEDWEEAEEEGMAAQEWRRMEERARTEGYRPVNQLSIH